MIRRPPRSTRTDTLFPYTTLFRSGGFVTADHDDHLSRFGKLGTATDRRIDQCDAMFRRHLGERLARLRGYRGVDGDHASPGHALQQTGRTLDSCPDAGIIDNTDFDEIATRAQVGCVLCGFGASGDEWLHCLCPLIPNGDVEPGLDQLHRERCALIAKADKANPFRCCIRHFWIPWFMPPGPPTGIVMTLMMLIRLDSISQASKHIAYHRIC